MLQGIRGCDVTIFLGYHGMAGGNNFMSHTNHEWFFKKVTINGTPVGEGHMNAAAARDLGTKLVLMSGTDAGVEEM